MKSLVLATLSTLAMTSGLTLFTASTADAAPNQKQKSIVVKSKTPNKVKRNVVIKPTSKQHSAKPRYRAPVKRVYVGKPYRGSLSYWAHPIASAIAFAILIDATTGDLQDDKGNNVVVLGDGGEVKHTYQQDGTVYIITE
ncbi:hypothetical protein [Vibrio hippocampi]|uniref:Uncharacterized protein n=1 Tax=Vibrio hippocampi TaxID=654686 RepID=A0ABM8ZME5_9VIBR|nr:hypothetical protein [Vibrio hippocampi]CAH0529707.1 hypothetical protein VHP8226_03462 [Vibrio hippocampi]